MRPTPLSCSLSRLTSFRFGGKRLKGLDRLGSAHDLPPEPDQSIKNENKMPRVNIYIRDEDWEAWKSIEDKPEFLHTTLQKVKLGTDLHPTTAARIVENKIKNAQEHSTNLHTSLPEILSPVEEAA